MFGERAQLIKMPLAICTHIYQDVTNLHGDPRKVLPFSVKSYCSSSPHTHSWCPNPPMAGPPLMAHMVRPQGFSLEQLRLTLGHSAIREQCYFIYGTNNILEVRGQDPKGSI